MKKERVVFFTIVGDDYYYPCGTHKMINSFKRYHPDIDLVVFRRDMIEKVFKEKGINFFTAKPTFAKILAPHYDLVVNIDADCVILGRCEEILKKDYDVGAAWNFNDYENRKVDHVTEEQFVQAGLVASRRKDFWDIWEHENRNAFKYVCAENDILNLIWYAKPKADFKFKIFDKDIKDFYGCKLLGKEKDCYLKDNKVMCDGGQVIIYHNAKGRRFPKLDYPNLGFPKDVANFMEALSSYGTTVLYGKI